MYRLISNTNYIIEEKLCIGKKVYIHKNIPLHNHHIQVYESNDVVIHFCQNSINYMFSLSDVIRDLET